MTDRTVLDAQLQETISGFDHTLGSVVTIDEKKSSKDLRDALNDGKRIIVTTLQSSRLSMSRWTTPPARHLPSSWTRPIAAQTGQSAMKLKMALADTHDALKEYAELEGKAEEELEDAEDGACAGDDHPRKAQKPELLRLYCHAEE